MNTVWTVAMNARSMNVTLSDDHNAVDDVGQGAFDGAVGASVARFNQARGSGDADSTSIFGQLFN